ncbi:MAG: zinc-ribbon domain containing protein [Clostridia bacterium]|nr:zinc-ribbon domain containing protein [Clostridia bacterium]
MERKCVQCGKTFTLTDSEIAFFKSKKLSLPKRCKACRDANRISKGESNIPKARKTIPVSAEANAQYHKAKRKSSPIYYLVALLIIIVIGVVTSIFGDFANPAYYDTTPVDNEQQQYDYMFADNEALVEHFQKHGHEFGYKTKEDYLQGANNVIKNPSALHKLEAEDGDDCYYLQATNEFVVVSPDGVIRTYFRPDDGIEYFNRQMITVYHFW